MESSKSHSYSYCSSEGTRSDAEVASPELKDAVHFLSELVGSYEAEVLYHACVSLADLIKNADSDCLLLLLERDVVAGIVRMMEALPSHSSAQQGIGCCDPAIQAGCDAILSCNERIELRTSLEDHYAFRQVLTAMETHSEDVQVVGKALQALASLALSSINNTPLKESRTYTYVLTAVRRHHRDLIIQSGGLLALATLLEMDSFAVSSVILQGDYDFIFESVKMHSRYPSVVAHGFRCLRSIAKCEVSSDKLQGITSNVENIIEIMRQYLNNEDVIAAVLGLLDALISAELRHLDEQAFDSAYNHFKAKNLLDMIDLVSQLLERFTEIADIQVYGFNILFYTCTLLESSVSVKFLDQWLMLLNVAMSYHGENNEINESCCLFLSKILRDHHHLHSRIGETEKDSNEKFPLHDHIWMILLNLSYSPNPSLFVAVSTAFSYLIESDDILQQLLLRKGATVALIECLRQYIGELYRNEKCVECGCRALKGILMHNCSDKQKEYLLSAGIFADIQTILDEFMDNGDVIAEVFCVIACLSDLSDFQESVIAHSLYKGILENVEKQISNAFLVESALEIVIILSLNANMIQYLSDVDMVGVTVSIMKKHVNFSSIQYKGCMLLRLLCDSKYLVSYSSCGGIARVVIDALSMKQDNKIQSEALACAQILCKSSRQMAEALVQGDIHILLFTLLYRDSSHVDVVDPTKFTTSGEKEHFSSNDNVENFFFQVGTDIIYTLSCIWDFKQEMLTTTIKDGLLEGADVLIKIGADVNAGSGDIMPICLAVLSKNKKMVEFLLDHGVSTNNVQEALKISWEKDLDEITGLLLEHITVDRSRDLVNMSGLKLTTLKPLWILPSLGVKVLPKAKYRRGHKKQRSLVHLKDVLIQRRRSVASEASPMEPDLRECTPEKRRTSIDLSSLKYISDKERHSNFIDETDSGIREHDKEAKLVPLGGASLVYHERESTPTHLIPPGYNNVTGEECNDSGVDTIGTVIQNLSINSLPGSPGDIRPVACFDVTFRATLHKQPLGTVTGTKALPCGQLDQYTSERRSDKNCSSVNANYISVSKADFSLSPQQLFRQLQKYHKNKVKNIRNESGSSYSTWVDSPVPLMYSGYQDEDMEMSSNIFSPLSDSYNSGNDSEKELPSSLLFDQSSERESSLLESSSMITPISSFSSPSIEGSGGEISSFNASRSSTGTRLGSDEIDFGSYEPIPEESVVHKQTSIRQIKMLDLSSNLLKNFDDLYSLPNGGGLIFRQLRDVYRLDLKQNNLSELLVDMMKEMTRLGVINLSCNNFSTFPVEALLSSKLTEIDLSSNKLTEIPSLPIMSNLSRFNLSHNHLKAMPDCMHKETRKASFPHLHYFDLRSNQISTIPNVDTQLRDLEVLNISRNQIKELPVEFLVSMPSLKNLDASRNEISCIGGDIGQDMVRLEELKLASNKLSNAEADFIHFITSIPVLQRVDASDNGLTSLPPPYAWKSLGMREIRYTDNLVRKLDLSGGKRFWSHLESLHIGQNKIREIPKEIGFLRSLTCLDISYNKDIKQLPEEMGDLEHLFMLNLQGLKNLTLDPSLLNGPTKGIISYLKSRHTRSVPYYHMKMMIVGAAEKGKTTLLHRVIQAKNVMTSSKTNVATMGVNVKQWNYPHRRPGGEVVTYHINCWDFAGQEEFYSTHQCFLSQRSLYVLVYNIYCGDSELKYLEPWLLNIQARAPSSLILVVGTHLDNFNLSPEDLDKKRVEMRSKIQDMIRTPGFPNEVSYAEISCFNDKQVNDLRSKVKNLIDSAKLRGQKIMGGLVPSNYIALEELIQREKKQQAKSRFPVLRESRLRELMEGSRLNSKMDKSELQQAIKFLHECGVLLHYSDLQTKLSELYFLDPEWLCTLMAHIITFKQFSFVDDKGFMEIKSIPHILKEPKFPAEFIPEYIRLLERFEVILRHTPNKLLIPSRLPKAKPSEAKLPLEIAGARLVRRYSLCYIPPGFFPRLIARLIEFPKGSVSTNIEKTLEPRIMHVWSGGIYLYWSQSSYCLLEVLLEQSNSFDIVVPLSSVGTRLLCNVVDNVEALIDEWFPGLRDLSVVGGAELIVSKTLCPSCPVGRDPHCFLLKDLFQLIYTVDEVECPVHRGKVKLEQLAPDIIIGDLDQKYRIAPGEFLFDESPQNVLGRGGFGNVYKAQLSGETVAVKVFSQTVASISNTTPNQLIRQEVQILSKLEHPHIISLVGVCLRPKAALVLEYAELGSLSSMHPYSNINIILKHKIVLQISSALAFLHKSSVIYRDLKPGNVLLFSLSTLAKVNAKLSDYGIACYATAGGLTQSVGTAGYRAPELLLSTSSNMPYHNKVDIYSYGLMLFELITNGHKPFEELSAGYEIDKFIAEGRAINDIDHYGCPPWPDMQDLINHCLQYSPADRPSFEEIFNRLCTSEFIALRRAIAIERDHPIETFAIRLFSDKRERMNIEVWVISSLGTQSMLSLINLTKRSLTPQGMMMAPKTLIYCMVAVDSSFVLMGTSKGSILVYDGYDKKLKHSLKPLEDSVLCLVHFKALKEGVYYVCAGLANGHLVIYDETLLTVPNAKGRDVVVGEGPVKNIKRVHGQLYVTCGTDVVVLRISDLKIIHRWKAIDNEGSFMFLTNIEVGQNLVWTTHNKSAKVHMWDQDDGSPTGVLHCDHIVNSMLPEDQGLNSYDTRITSMLLQQSPHSVLWIGLGSGHLLLLNAVNRRALMLIKRHVSSVRYLAMVKAILDEKPVNYIISGGFGFQQRPGQHSIPSKGTPETYGSLLVWDSIMPRMKQIYDEIRKDLNSYR